MRTFVFALVTLASGVAAAGNCRTVVRVRAVVAQPALVVTPFAVPVAVPVATFAAPTVLYSYQGYTSARPPAAAAQAEAAPQQVASAAEAPTLVQQKCARCHGGAAPKAGLDLTDLGRLDAAKRLEAVRRVLSDDPAVRMPKGATLAPAEIGAVLQELSGK